MTKLYIIGLGLMGGSLAKAFKGQDQDIMIYGYDTNDKNCQLGLADGTVNQVVDYRLINEHTLQSLDYIFLACPVEINLDIYRALAPRLSEKTIVTDIGSTKADFLKQISQIPSKGTFIGGHPMTGSEKSGYQYAFPHLYENAYYLLTPFKNTPASKVDQLSGLLASTQAIIDIIDPAAHDYITAGISHVPHILAALLVQHIKKTDTDQKKMFQLAAGGFRDITRIASASPLMWEHICMTNKEEILSHLTLLERDLKEMKEAIASMNSNAIYDFFDQAKEYRNAMNSSIRGSIEKTYRLYVNVEDKAGAIAEIVQLISASNISIKNIGINNNREDYDGVLEILFDDQESLQRSSQLLNDQYQIFIDHN